jgi:hypothetical protein
LGHAGKAEFGELIEHRMGQHFPRRMSVRPTASQTRTSEGTGIIAAPAHPTPAAVRRP